MIILKRIIKAAVLLIPVILYGIIFVLLIPVEVILGIFRVIKANSRPYTKEEYLEDDSLDIAGAGFDLGNPYHYHKK